MCYQRTLWLCFLNEFSFVGRAKLAQRNAKVDWLFLPSSPDNRMSVERRRTEREMHTRIQIVQNAYDLKAAKEEPKTWRTKEQN